MAARSYQNHDYFSILSHNLWAMINALSYKTSNRLAAYFAAFLGAALLLLVAPNSWGVDNPFQVEILKPQISLTPSRGDFEVGVRIRLPHDHYLYQDKTSLVVTAPDDFTVGTTIAPPTQSKDDPYLKKKLSIYSGATGEIVLKRQLSVRDQARSPMSYLLKVELNYQGCGPKFCFLPMHQEWMVKVVSSTEATTGSPNLGRWNFSEIIKRGWFWALLVAFLGGLVSSLTPCVYPMIPITIAVIGAKQASSRWHSLKLGATFALGLALTYATFGWIAASSGSLLGGLLQNQWLLLAVVLIFMSMGLSLMGLFEFRLPYFVNRWVAQLEGKGGRFSILLTGAVTGIVAAPCVGPVILGILTFVAGYRDPLLGFSLLFIFALGLATPFVLLGVFTALLQRLPKSGPWMEIIKHILGLMLVGVACYYIHPLMPKLVYHLFLLGMILMMAVLIRWRWLLGKRGSIWIFGLLLLTASALLFGTIMPQIEKQFSTSPSEHSMKWESSLESALERSRKERLPVIVDFFAEWCLACKHLDETTYRDEAVVTLSKQFIAVKLDFTELNSENEKLLRQYQVSALPAILFFGRDGEPLSEFRIDGLVDGPTLSATMNTILKK